LLFGLSFSLGAFDEYSWHLDTPLTPERDLDTRALIRVRFGIYVWLALGLRIFVI
jgi:hypothetical protein